jgi:hypothetical protein
VTTAQNIIEAAYSRSTSNDPGKLAVDLELIGHLNRKYQSVFAVFGIEGGDTTLAKTTMLLAGLPGTAALPADIADITRLEDANGKKVHIVPAEEKDRSWHLSPAVFRQGLSLVSLARSGDPVLGQVLTLFYIDAPAPLVALATALDARFPARFEQLLILDLAIYLSLKDDGRDNKEYEELKAELTTAERDFEALVKGGQTAGKQ